MSPRVPEPAELADDLAKIQQAIETLGDRIERNYVPREVFALEMRRVEKLEDRSTWIARLAVSGLVLPILVAVVAAIIIAGVAG